MGPVREIITILSAIGKERAKEEAAKRAEATVQEEAEKPVATKRKASLAGAPAVMDIQLAEDDTPDRKPPRRDPEGGTVVPAVENGAEACQIGTFVSTLSPTPGVCIKAVTGPVIVTDLHTSGACQSDLFILGGSTEGARWLMLSPAKTPLHVTGGRLLVRPNESLTVGIATKTHADVRCAVTWSGERP